MKFYLALIAYLFLVVESRLNDQQDARIGCGRADHLQCDEICKTDGYWYGNCKVWDGKDFECNCLPYKKPLDGLVCKNMKEYCMNYCQKTGSEGGYCYPQSSWNNVRGTPTCSCFGKFLA